jgi:hypothetical protein
MIFYNPYLLGKQLQSFPIVEAWSFIGLVYIS